MYNRIKELKFTFFFCFEVKYLSRIEVDNDDPDDIGGDAGTVVVADTGGADADTGSAEAELDATTDPDVDAGNFGADAEVDPTTVPAIGLDAEVDLTTVPAIGDDTNGHIDNFIRFIDNETIVYFASKDKSYCNYQLACKLSKQVKDIVDRSKIIKRAIPLYHSKDDELIKNGKIYPYSKVNFIATTECFIFPCISNNRESLQHDLDGLPSKTKMTEKLFFLNSSPRYLK